MDKDILINYNGNEDEFKKYRIELEMQNTEKIIYNNRTKKKIYEGNLLNSLYDGIGILYDENDDNKIKYKGYFKEGMYNGFGTLYDNNNLIYEGFFEYNRFNGKGTLYKNKIKKYEGNFFDGQYHGIGIEYLSSGKRKRKAFYSYGKILENCNCILYNENDEEIYNGILSNGIPEKGKSLIIYIEDDGDDDYILYKGDFESFQYNGKGILYYKKNNIVRFNGIFKENKFFKGILYYKSGYKEYEGEFNENKYDGNGILYFEKHNYKFFEGSFIKGEMKNGKLYGLENELIYDGEFKRNIPKKGKNIKLYKLNGYLKYDGDISNFLYEGKGKIIDGNTQFIFNGILKQRKKIYGIIYENSRKKYEGQFENDKFNGYGKIYRLDNDNINYLYYEGNFEDGEISGMGIKYYKNGSKKIEGYFHNIFLFDGNYYSPDKELVFKGKISSKIIFSNKFVLYNDGGENLYSDKLNDNNNIINNNYFNKDIKEIKVLFMSTGFPGKTSLINILTGTKFSENSLATIGIDYKFIDYEYLTNLYQMKIFDTPGQKKYKPILFDYFKKSDVVIILFDLSQANSIDDSLLNNLKDFTNSKEKLIYLVGNKLDIADKYLEYYREKAEKLINTGIINKYFEISARTGEGIDNFSNTLKIDGAILYMTTKDNKKKNSKRKKHINQIENLSQKLKDLDENISQYLKDIEEKRSDYLINKKEYISSISKFNKLNKFLDY